MNHVLRAACACMLACTIHFSSSAQSVSINTDGSTAHASALLDVKSTNKGVLVPRMSKAEKNAIASPANGLLVYQTGPDSIGFHFYDLPNARWTFINASGFSTDSTAWKITGNNNITAANFLGTLNDSALNFRVKNQKSGSIDSINFNTSFGYGTSRNLNYSGGLNGKINSAFGYKSLDSTTTGSANTAFGSHTLIGNKTGSNNAVVGNDAGRLNNADQNTAIGSSALRNDSTGSGNIAIGYQASIESDTASYTIAIGTQAMYYNTIDSNIAVGYQSGFYANSNPSYPSREQTLIGTYAGYGSFASSKNTALGFKALMQINPANGLATDYIVGGGRNVAIGDSALAGTIGISNIAIGPLAIARGGVGLFRNVAIGDSSMSEATLISDNVAIGYHSLQKASYGVSTSTGNTATGAYSARSLTTGYWNTINGYFALENSTTAAGNTAIGTSSFRSNITGFDNVGVGINTGFNVTSSNNTFVGGYAGEGATGFSTGSSNTGVGHFALNDVRSGSNNTAVGSEALISDTSGTGNVAIGRFAMYFNLASDYNTAVGYNSLFSHKRVGFTYNTALGSFALEQDSTGYQNTGVGTSAFRNNKTGILNTGVGINAGYYQKESYNTYIGAYSGVGERSPGTDFAADTGNYNSGLGPYSLYRIANGSSNVAVGYNTLYADSSGNYNTAIGNSSLNFTNSDGNTALGYAAGTTNTTGTYNTVLGYNAELSAPNLTNSTAIGANAQVFQSNSMVLGSINGINGATATVSVGIGENSPNARLHVKRSGASGGTYHASSSVIIEDNNSSYLQFTNPSASETGLLSGNAVTTIRSALIFRADSSIQLRAGGNNNRMHIDNNGYIGIGTTTPLTKVHVYEGTAVNVNLRVASFSTSYEPGIELIKTGGGTDWRIKTATTGNLVYTRSVDDLVTPIDEYEMSSTSFRPFTDGSNTLGTAANRWSTVYSTVGAINTSDARDKENITSLNYGLNEILKLRPVSFTWKENPQWGRKIGFIAQEVQPVLGEVVQTGELKRKTAAKDDNGKDLTGNNDKLGIYYSDIIPVTVKAIQEQQQLIIKQQKTIDELMERIKKLENKQ